MAVYQLGEISANPIPIIEGLAPESEDIQSDNLLELGTEAFTTSEKRNYVIDRQPLNNGRPEVSRFGKAYPELVTLENGRHYEVVNGVPKHPRTDIPVFIGTALGTSIYGHNWHTMLDMMELGYPVVLVGPEGGRLKVPRTPKELRRATQNLACISIKETANNMLEILDDNEQKELYAPGKIVKTGESRDAAVAMGVNAQAKNFGIQVVYTDAIAVPFPTPKPLELNLELPKRALEIGEQVMSLALQSSQIRVRRLRHYPRTLNLNPYFLLHVVATVPTLVGGATGKLAKEIPRSRKMHLTHFESDPWSDPEEYAKIFKSYPHVVQDVLPGDHGGIMRESVQQARVDRMRRLREELESHHDHTRGIDWNYVHFGGRLALAKAA